MSGPAEMVTCPCGHWVKFHGPDGCHVLVDGCRDVCGCELPADVATAVVASPRVIDVRPNGGLLVVAPDGDGWIVRAGRPTLATADAVTRFSVGRLLGELSEQGSARYSAERLARLLDRRGPLK
jgi:hypothetical protein